MVESKWCRKSHLCPRTRGRSRDVMVCAQLSVRQGLLLSDPCYPKQSKRMLTLPTLHGRELCFFPRVMKAAVVLSSRGFQHKLFGSLGSPSSCPGAARTAHGVAAARAVELGEGPGWPRSPGLAQLPCGHPSVPWRVCGTPESPICSHDELPEQPSERGMGTSE